MNALVALMLASSAQAFGRTTTKSRPTGGVGLGGDSAKLYRTFSMALTPGVEAPELPMDRDTAKAGGWVIDANPKCDSALGIKYNMGGDAPSQAHPLSIFFTAAGQIAGVGTRLYDRQSGDGVSFSDLGRLVEDGWYKPAAIPNGMGAHDISISFRAPGVMCSPIIAPETVGDRAVVNQDSLAFAMPLTIQEATDGGFQEGSCMKTMGQHFFKNLDGGDLFGHPAALLPVVPMYYPPADPSGKLVTIFFASAVQQPGSAFSNFPGDSDWEVPALDTTKMCKNFCDEACYWEDSWSTMHIYLNYDGPNKDNPRTCPGAPSHPIGNDVMDWLAGRACYNYDCDPTCGGCYGPGDHECAACDTASDHPLMCDSCWGDYCVQCTNDNDCIDWAYSHGSSTSGGSSGGSSGGDDSCQYANDHECDEPQYCAYGTDTSDCGGSSSGDSSSSRSRRRLHGSASFTRSGTCDTMFTNACYMSFL